MRPVLDRLAADLGPEAFGRDREVLELLVARLQPPGVLQGASAVSAVADDGTTAEGDEVPADPAAETLLLAGGLSPRSRAKLCRHLVDSYHDEIKRALTGEGLT